jgi:predicted MFS family arabinose efflux permease
MLIFGRLLQGAGAIGGVILAYIADLTDEDNTAKAFAKMGQFIALSFALSMILGPTIGAEWGVDKLFILTALLALFSIWIVIAKIPKAPNIVHHQEHAGIKNILTHKELLKLFFSGFLQKGLMTVFFMLTPIIFTTKLHWEKTDLWKVYIPALILGIFALPLGAILAEKKQKAKMVFIMSATLITLSLILFLIGNKYTFAAVVVFFFGFNLLEPVLQSFVSKIARAHEKATALSTSNTIQYLGIFLGGALAGYFAHNNMLNVFLVLSIIIGLFWTFLLIKMKPVAKLKTVVYEKYDKDFIENLKSEKNVYDFYEKDGVLIVRYF